MPVGLFFIILCPTNIDQILMKGGGIVSIEPAKGVWRDHVPLHMWRRELNGMSIFVCGMIYFFFGGGGEE